MRLAAAIIILALLACALLASHQHRPFYTRIDAQSPGAWPQYAGGEWCDVKPEPVKPPRGKYDYRVGAKREGGIA